jgi:glycerophosphoryl diester phosphodiesterase
MNRILAAGAIGTLALLTVASTANAVLISGHRGAFRASVPEQTMSAFRYAKAHGADIIEFDVRWTKDQRKYLMHDAHLDRTTNGIPSFREVTVYAKSAGLLINPEVKPVLGHPFIAAQAKSYVKIIYLYGMQKRTVVSSISPKILNLIKRYDTKKAMRYSLIQSGPLHSVSEVAAMGSVYMPQYTSLTPDYVQALHDRGVQVWAWPIRTEADREAALALGVDVLVEDDPHRGALS